MNKEEFLKELAEQIKKHSKKEITGSVEYYREMIEDRIEDGMTESEAVESLGTISTIVEQIEQEYTDNNGEKKRSKRLVICTCIVALLIVITGGVVIYSILDHSKGTDIPTYEPSKKMTTVEDSKVIAKENVFSITGSSAVKSISTDLVAFKVAVVRSKEDKIRVTYMDRNQNPLYKIGVKDGVLTMKMVSRNTLDGFDGIPQRDVTLIRDEKIVFTLYIPENYEGDYDIDNTAGDLDITGIHAKKDMAIDVVSGEINLKNTIIEGDFDCTSTSGDVTGENITIGRVMQLSAVSGDVEMSNLLYGEKGEIDVTSGNANLSFADDKDSYSIASDVTSGDSNLPESYGQGGKKLTVEVISGDLNVEFLGDK